MTIKTLTVKDKIEINAFKEKVWDVTFPRIPAKIIHDFANRTNEKSEVRNFFIPGGFEKNIPYIVK